MIDHIERIKDEAQGKISSAPSTEELERLRVHYLGKKGLVTNLLHQLRELAPEKRREMGSVLNKVKQDFESALHIRQEELARVSIEQELRGSAPLDFTLPGQNLSPPGSLHPITRVIDDVIECMHRIGFSVVTGPEVELERYNFECLNTPEDHPARDMQDTFYLMDPPVLLRSHTSPVQIRTMEKRKPPLMIIAPGKVYRSDYDQTHTPMFHQVEGLMVDRHLSLADLKGIVQYMVKSVFGPRKLRFRPSYFPFTEPSAEIDMQWTVTRNGRTEQTWMEIGGCGMVHPNVLRSGGYDPDEVNGFAFGMGVERIAMLKYGIDDLRSFFENDHRMLEQF